LKLSPVKQKKPQRACSKQIMSRLCHCLIVVTILGLGDAFLNVRDPVGTTIDDLCPADTVCIAPPPLGNDSNCTLGPRPCSTLSKALSLNAVWVTIFAGADVDLGSEAVSQIPLQVKFPSKLLMKAGAYSEVGLEMPSKVSITPGSPGANVEIGFKNPSKVSIKPAVDANLPDPEDEFCGCFADEWDD
jgi:hypothetical protein